MSGGFFNRPHLAELCSGQFLEKLRDYIAEKGYPHAARRTGEILGLMDQIGEIQHEMYGVWQAADRLASGDDGPAELDACVARWEAGSKEDRAEGGPLDPFLRAAEPRIRSDWALAELQRVNLVQLGYPEVARRLAAFQDALNRAASLHEDLGDVLEALRLVQGGHEPRSRLEDSVRAWRQGAAAQGAGR